MLISQIFEKSFYVGEFKISKSSEVTFETEYERQDFISFGDVVYFMFVGEDLFTEDMLFKIGKAGGTAGFYDRANTYKRGYKGDKTNKKILDVMHEHEANNIRVFAVSCPKIKTTIQCPVRGVDVQVELETHSAIEKSLTQVYLDEDKSNFLPFCTQLK